MSELSVKIANLKRKQTTRAVIGKAGISRETFRRIERGDSVKLNTLKQIVEALGGNKSDWLETLVAWIKGELGDDVDKFDIQLNGDDILKSQAQSKQVHLNKLFEKLPQEQRLQVIKILQRPEILRCLPSLNALYE